MWQQIILWSLKNRVMVLMMAGALLIYGGYLIPEMSIDALPEVSAPTVTVMAGGYGMAADEIEQGITIPLEGVLGGILKGILKGYLRVFKGPRFWAPGKRLLSSMIPQMAISVVDLPAPLAPMMVTTSPGYTFRDIPLRAWILP